VFVRVRSFVRACVRLQTAGFENTSLLFTLVEVELSVYITPFCPIWRAGTPPCHRLLT
jgi:hypothetical protein